MLNSVLSNHVTLWQLLLCLGCAAVFGLVNMLAFRFRSVTSRSFSLTLVVLPVAVSAVVMLVNGSIGLGLVTAGTFAMARFRSMPGTAREICAVFVSIALGIACGTGCLTAGLVLVLVTSLLCLLLTVTRICDTPANTRLLKLTVPEHLDYNTAFAETFAKHQVKATLLTVRTANMGTLMETSWELVLPSAQIPKAFLDDLRTVNSNLSVAITSPGEKQSL